MEKLNLYEVKITRQTSNSRHVYYLQILAIDEEWIKSCILNTKTIQDLHNYEIICLVKSLVTTNDFGLRVIAEYDCSVLYKGIKNELGT